MISYARPQEDLAIRLHERLSEVGHAPKLDCLDIDVGERFQHTLDWWLSACQIAVVLLSIEAMDSAWVRYELDVLLHRHHVAGDVTLILAYVGGATLADVASRPGLELLGLAAFESIGIGGAPDEHTFDDVVDAIGQSPPRDPAVERLIGGVYAIVRDASPQSAIEARAFLRVLGGRVADPWREDGDIPRERDSRGPEHWALSQDLCAHTLGDLYGPLQRLARDKHVAGDVDILVDLNLLATIDSAACTTLHRAAMDDHKPVVLGVTDAGLASLVANNVCRFHPLTMQAFAFDINVDLTGAATNDYVDAISAQLLLEISRSDDDPEGFLVDMPTAGHPVYVLMHGADGLNRDILDGLVARFPRVSFVVVATERTDPDTWSTDLGGLPVAGPHLARSNWGAFVEVEAALVTCRDATRLRLRRVLRAAFP